MAQIKLIDKPGIDNNDFISDYDDACIRYQIRGKDLNGSPFGIIQGVGEELSCTARVTSDKKLGNVFDIRIGSGVGLYFGRRVQIDLNTEVKFSNQNIPSSGDLYYDVYCKLDTQVVGREYAEIGCSFSSNIDDTQYDTVDLIRNRYGVNKTLLYRIKVSANKNILVIPKIQVIIPNEVWQAKSLPNDSLINGVKVSDVFFGNNNAKVKNADFSEKAGKSAEAASIRSTSSNDLYSMNANFKIYNNTDYNPKTPLFVEDIIPAWARGNNVKIQLPQGKDRTGTEYIDISHKEIVAFIASQWSSTASTWKKVKFFTLLDCDFGNGIYPFDSDVHVYFNLKKQGDQIKIDYTIKATSIFSSVKEVTLQMSHIYMLYFVV